MSARTPPRSASAALACGYLHCLLALVVITYGHSLEPVHAALLSLVLLAGLALQIVLGGWGRGPAARRSPTLAAGGGALRAASAGTDPLLLSLSLVLSMAAIVVANVG